MVILFKNKAKNKNLLYILTSLLGLVLSVIWFNYHYDLSVDHKKEIFLSKSKERIVGVENRIKESFLDLEIFADRLVAQGMYYEESFYDIAEKVQLHMPYVKGFYFAYKNSDEQYVFDYAWPVDHRSQEVLDKLNDAEFNASINWDKLTLPTLSKGFVFEHRSNNTGFFIVVPLLDSDNRNVNNGVLIGEVLWSDLISFTFKDFEPAHLHYLIQIDDVEETEFYYVSRGKKFLDYSTLSTYGKPVEFDHEKIIHIGGRKIKLKAESLDFGQYHVSPFEGFEFLLYGLSLTALVVFVLYQILGQSTRYRGLNAARYEMLESRFEVLKVLLAEKKIQPAIELLVKSIEERMPHAKAAIHLLDENGIVNHVATDKLGLMYRETFLKRNLKSGEYKASAFYHSKRHVSIDISYEPSWQAYKKIISLLGLQSCWSIPLYSDSLGLVGIMTVYVNDKYIMDKEALAYLNEMASLCVFSADVYNKEDDKSMHYNRYQVISEHNGSIAMIFDEQLRFKYVSPQFLIELRGDESDFIGHRFTQGLPLSEHARIESFFEEASENPSVPFTFEVYPKTLDDEARLSYECQIIYMPDADGVNGYMAKLTDISERKEVEAGLLETKRNLSSIIENIPGVVFQTIYSTTFKRISCEFVSASIYSYTGHEREDFLGEKSKYQIRDFMNEDDVTLVQQKIFEAIENKSLFECPFRFLDKDGKEYHMVMMARATTSVKSDDLCVVEGIMVDNTRAVQAENELKNIQRILTETFHRTPESFYRVKVDDYYTANFLSENIYDLLGYKVSEFIGQGGTVAAKKVMDMPNMELVEENVNNALEGDSRYHYKLRLIHKNGDPVWVDNNGAVLQDDATGEFISDGLLKRIDADEAKKLEDSYQQKLAELEASKAKEGESDPA